MPQPSLHPVPRVEMTRKRLWYLYCLLGIGKSQIEELTGWSRYELDRGLDRWQFRMMSFNTLHTNSWLALQIANHLGLPYTVENLPRLDELRRRLVDDLGAQLRAGQIDWKAIDGMPMPDDLDVGRS